MKRYAGLGLLVCYLIAGAVMVVAQSGGDSNQAPPPVLVVSRELLKPGKGGSAHAKAESALLQAMTAAKAPTRYLGTDAMSGPSRSVFFIGYDSFAAWEKDNLATMGNTTLSAALDRAFQADGELLTSYETSAFVYRPDLSYSPNVDIGQMRYFEVDAFHTKPGHEMEWEEIAKMYVASYGKAIPNAPWATYQAMFGAKSGGVYVVIIPMKSLAEVDAAIAGAHKFMSELGEPGMKKMMELSASSTEWTETNLLAFNPNMSYPPDGWTKSDPSFWKPKAAAPAKKPAPKPAQ